MQFACLIPLPDMSILCTEMPKNLYGIEMTITVHVKHQTETKASWKCVALNTHIYMCDTHVRNMCQKHFNNKAKST